MNYVHICSPQSVTALSKWSKKGFGSSLVLSYIGSSFSHAKQDFDTIYSEVFQVLSSPFLACEENPLLLGKLYGHLAIGKRLIDFKVCLIAILLSG